MDMTGLPGTAGAFGALMLAAAVHSATRLVVAWRTRRGVDTAVDVHHILMGISMAGMLLPGLGILPPGPATTAWTTAWAIATGWFALDIAVRAVRSRSLRGHARHHLPHLAMSAAMLYMLAALLPPSGHAGAGSAMAGMRSSGPMVAWPTLDLALLAFMVAYTAAALDRASAQAPRAARAEDARAGQPFLAPRLASLANAAMGLAMAYMLAMMLA